MSRLPTKTAALLAAGLLLRLASLPLWGTFDTEVQKAWSARAASVGVADIYGPPDSQLLVLAHAEGRSTLAGLASLQVPQTWFEWQGNRYFVDYPPGSVLALFAAGRLYSLLDSELPNGPLFNAAINLAPLLGSLVIAALLWRSTPDRQVGARRTLAFWFNPALLLATPVLGYQDTVFAAFALGAVLALMARRAAMATALVVAAGLVKPQGALLLPALAVVLWKEEDRRGITRSVAAGLGVAAAILAPWWLSGYLLSALDGALRPLRQTTLAPLGFNLWWIAGYAMDWTRVAPWPLARIVGLEEFQGWTGFDARVPARVALALATLAVAWLLASRLREDRRLIPLSVMLQVHGYALLNTSVHENHTLLAVILAPLLLGAWPRARAALFVTSAFLFANLFLTYGFGRRLTRQAWLAELRLSTGVDLSVLVAAAHVVLVVTLFVWVLQTPPGSSRPGRSALDAAPMPAPGHAPTGNDAGLRARGLVRRVDKIGAQTPERSLK